MKVASPDFKRVEGKPRGCIEIDAPSGRRYDFRKGIAEVTKRDAKAIVAEGGFIPSLAGTTGRHLGYRCVRCGFGSYFNECGRCGAIAMREEDLD